MCVTCSSAHFAKLFLRTTLITYNFVDPEDEGKTILQKWVIIYPSSRCNVTESLNFQRLYCENLKSRNIRTWSFSCTQDSCILCFTTGCRKMVSFTVLSLNETNIGLKACYPEISREFSQYLQKNIFKPQTLSYSRFVFLSPSHFSLRGSIGICK